MFRQKRRVRLYFKDGPTMDGVMAGKTRDTYIIWAPRLITEAEDPKDREVDLTGHVEVPRTNVLYWQVLG